MATRFRFRLEGLLKLRKALEQDAQRVLGKAVQARDLIELRMKKAMQEHETVRLSRRANPGEPIDLDQWRAIERYLVVLERNIERARTELQEAENRVVQAREALKKAHQDHLTLMHLKERRQEEHAQELLKEEFRDQDELAVLRYRFKRRPVAAIHEVSP